ncbi:MAG: GDP-mannose 4,6-dehydratase [Candidatus Margulisiibacteriota bacterium]
MKALITGINGFAGSHLCDLLLAQGYEVHGLIQPDTGTENIIHCLDGLKLEETDILDENKLHSFIASDKPDFLFHLAAASSVKLSLEHPKEAFDANVSGTVNILEAVRNGSPKTRALIVSSSEVYGASSSMTKADENAALLPLNPYSASKASADILARTYASSFGLNIIVARPGNHLGPRQSPVFFVPTVAKQVALIMKERQAPVIELGNIDVKRDFLDVRDVADAYLALAKSGKTGAYNISSGKNYLLRDIVQMFIAMSGKKIAIRRSSEKLRRTDALEANIDNSKISRETGWKPEVPIEKTLRDTLDYWLLKS